MSFRKKTIKFGEKFTPTPAPPPTPKAPSPKAPKIVRTITPTVTTGVKVTPKPTTQRGQISQTAAGIAVQEEFKRQLQSNPIVIAANQALNNLYQISKSYDFQRFSTPTEKDLHQRNIQDEEKKIQDVEHKLIEVELAANVQQIISAIESRKLIIPDYFNNNIIWVKSGAITSQAFLDAYYYLSNQGIIHSPIAEPEIIEEPIIELPELSANVKITFTNPNIGGFSSSISVDDIGELQILSNVAPEWKYTLIGSSTNQPISTLSELINNINDLLASVEPEPEPTIIDNMVTQQVINFNIINGRAVGSIRFLATNNFNPYYFNKPIVNIIQIKDPNGAKILDVVKENRLNFTETERDEIINYDEDMQGNTRATVESFVWTSATQPTAFSKMYSIEISEAEPPKPITSGFMGAGVAGAIASLILIGFIADHKRGK
jgi:hypothetical protein